MRVERKKKKNQKGGKGKSALKFVLNQEKKRPIHVYWRRGPDRKFATKRKQKKGLHWFQ